MPLQHLFDAELTCRTCMAPLADHGEGQLTSGDGSARGQRVRRALRWTLFEGPGELVCTMNPTLAIRTDHGASIGLEASAAPGGAPGHISGCSRRPRRTLTARTATQLERRS